VIKVCKSIPCFLREYQVILEAIEREIGIKANETTVDGRFSIQLTNCIGACDKAPSIMINDDFHTDVTPEKIPQILQEYQ
jgi:NADH-quinone oxidoreductase subunit E